MAKYAATTKVPPEKSAEEIKGILRKHGAESIGVMESQSEGIIIIAQMNSRNLKFVVPFQDTEKEYWRKWRVLVVKVKMALEDLLEANTQADFDQSLMNWIMMPNGQTCGEFAREGIEHAYSNGQMPSIGIEYKPPTSN